MKNSLRLSIALGLCAWLSTIVLAAPMAGKAHGNRMQGAKMGDGMRAERRGGGMDRMAKELGLTDAQKAKMRAIMQAQRPRMKALRENQSLTGDQKMSKMREMRAARMKQMAAILTPVQRKKMQAMMKDRRSQRDHKM